MILNPKHIAVLLVLTLILTNLLISYAKPDILFIELAAGTGVLIVFFGYIPYLFVVKPQLDKLSMYRIVARRHKYTRALGYQPQRRVYWFFWTSTLDSGELWFSDRCTCQLWINVQRWTEPK